jgi:hypothetical protein
LETGHFISPQNIHQICLTFYDHIFHNFLFTHGQHKITCLIFMARKRVKLEEPVEELACRGLTVSY